MPRVLAIFVFILFGSFVPGAAEAIPEPTLFIIPHTHWEGAVFKTREEYLEIGLTHLLTVIRLLKEHPDYRFTLDQVAYFRPFVERYPAEVPAFKKFIAEGRLQIVGGLNVMPDDNMPSGESFIRQMLYAKTYCREVLGTDVKTGWLVDTFGHHAQLPQLLRLGGFDTFWFSRGVEDKSKMPTDFYWQGIDGTRIRAFWLPLMYGNFAWPPRDFPTFNKYARDRYNELAPYVRNHPMRTAFNGADVTDPDLYVPPLIHQFNAQTNKPFNIRLAVPAEVERALSQQTNLPIVTGERNPLFQGVYSTRIELKHRMRESERLLTTAEKFGALAHHFGGAIYDESTERAWDSITFNVTHDLASGVMTDDVYQDTVRGYDFSARLANELIDTRSNDYLARVNTAGEGIPIAVCNTLGWTRTDAAKADVGFSEGGIKDFDLIDAAGKTIPAQIVEEEKYPDGGLRRVHFVFIAREIPALGHNIYHVVPNKNATAKRPATDRSANFANASIQANFDLSSGTLTSLRRQHDQWESLSGPANNIAVEPDHGDVWELYKNLDGGQQLIMTRPLPTPKSGGATFSANVHTTNCVARRGPVFTEFETSNALGTNSFTTKARLFAELDRVEFETRIINRAPFVRYRMLAPTTISNGKNFQEIPFGAIERPMSQEFPAQNWIDYSDGAHGLALLNRGNPGNNISENTLMLSLLRSTRIQSYGFGGGFEGQSSDSALELNKPLTIHYALVPHAGTWTDASIYRAGLEFNNPLLIRKVSTHPGPVPARWGLLEISAPNVVVSAVKTSHDGATIIRVYEAAGRATADVQLKLHANIRAVSEVNLIEDKIAPLKSKQNTLHFNLHPFEIKTFKLELKR